MGFEYDLKSTSADVLTHAKAYARHADTKLVAVCDIREQAARNCAEQYNARAFTDAHQMMEESEPDIVSISTPDKTHLDFLELCLEYPVKAVWCEKPLAGPGQDPTALVEKYERSGKILAVNYLRRWEPAHERIRQYIADGKLGTIQKVVACYSKGFLHAGSHFIDLFLYWFGEMDSWTVLGRVADGFDDDPTLDLHIRFRNGPDVYLLGGNEAYYSLDEIDILGERCRVRVTDYSRTVQTYVPETFLLTRGPYLPASPETEETAFRTVMLVVLESILRAMQMGDSLPSQGKTALATLEWCRRIQESTTKTT